MWKPPDRIIHKPSFGRVPTRDEADASRLFSPIAVGPIRLHQRSWVPAMVPWRATEEGYVTDITWRSTALRSLAPPTR